MNLKKKNHGLLNTTTVREINERIISEAVKININKLITGIKIWVVLGNGGEREVFFSIKIIPPTFIIRKFHYSSSYMSFKIK